MTPELDRVARQVRSLTGPCRNRLNPAIKGGYSIQITDCMANGAVGLMDFHCGDGAAIDANVEPGHPEALLYEPGRGGTMELVGVEYLVPLAARTDPNPPTLLGVPFLRNDVFQVWALPFWVGRKNPSGIFSDWNPKASCAGAPAGQVHNH